MKLKLEKGFNINTEDAESNVHVNPKQFESNVSSALSTN